MLFKTGCCDAVDHFCYFAGALVVGDCQWQYPGQLYSFALCHCRGDGLDSSDSGASPVLGDGMV